MKFPKIESPCPLRWRALPTAERNFCTQCDRKVHNLSGMTEVQRRQFLASCSGKVCIAYTVPHARPAAALRMGIGMLAAMVAAPAIAQDAAIAREPESGSVSPFTGVHVLPYAQQEGVHCDDENTGVAAERLDMDLVVIGGTVDDPANVRWVEADAASETLPVVRDDAFLDAEFIAAPESSRKR